MGNMRTLSNTISRSQSKGIGRYRKNGNGNGNENGAKPIRSSKFLFEPIEPRLLLSTDLAYAGTAAFDLTLRYDEPTQKIQLIDNATSTTVLEQNLSDTSAVNIHGSSDSDKLTIDFSSPFELAGGINFDDATQGDNNLLEITGKPSTNWNITGPDSGSADGGGGVLFWGIENLKGSADSDIFTLLSGGSISGLLDGGSGENTLIGEDADNTWTISGAGSGSVEGVAFSNVENLSGGSGADTFAFSGGSAASVDGGAGSDTLDLSADTAGVVVDLSAGTATNAGAISSIENVVTGAGKDTLYGPAEDTTWYIAGDDAGNIDDIDFSGLENLKGAPDNADTFVFEAAGNVSGLIDGGAGGFDSLEIAGGSYQTVIYSATGPDSGQIDLDGSVISYANLEPITDNGDAINRVFTGTVLADNITLKELIPGFLTITSDNGTFESHIFSTLLTTSLTIDAAGADDRITIQALPDYAGTVTLQGGADDDTLIVRAPTAAVTLNNTQAQIGTEVFAYQTIEEVIVYSATLNDTSTNVGVMHVAGIPEWVEQGPAPILGGAGLVPTPITGIAQAGTATTITLAASASAQDGFYNNMVVRISGGAGRIGQTFRIASYVGATRVATIAGTWTTTPNNTSTYQIYSNQNTGAVSVVAPHPTDPNVIFIGTVNGGIWKAVNAVIGLDKVDNDIDGFIDANDPDEAFRWIPLTDQFPSLSISAITFDPTNPLVLYAGTGKVSSSFSDGKGIGLLKSTDGGDTWTLLSIPDFQDLTIQKIVVLPGNVVLVASDARGVGTATEKGGLYRSTDGGAHFSKISGNGADQRDNNKNNATDELAEFTGLPGGSVTDLWVDPTDNQVIYLASTTNGFYKSTNGGQTWNAINTGLPETILPTPATSFTAQGIKLNTTNTIIFPAIASATDDAYVDWYVQITGGTGTVGQRFIITDYDGVTRTATIAGNWTTTPDNTTTFQLHRVAPPNRVTAWAGTGAAQGGSNNTIIFPADANATDDIYVGWTVQITGGTGKVGERFVITDYVGATTTVTIDGKWTTAPDNTTTFIVFRDFTQMRLEMAVSPVDIGGMNPLYAALISSSISSTTTAVSAANQVTINSTVTNTPGLSLFEAGDSVTLSGTNAAGNPISETLSIARVTIGGATTTLLFTGNLVNGPYNAGATVTYGRDRLSSLYRSIDEGLNWTAIALPNSTDTVRFDADNSGFFEANANEVFTQTFGIHHGGQGNVHFSIVADPTRPDVIYIGGDTQAPVGSFDTNGNGNVADAYNGGGAGTRETFSAAGFFSFNDLNAGRLMIGNVTTSTWSPIVGSGANMTAPHSDSRGMVFDSTNTTILEIDDGGIYRLTNAPNNLTRTWESLLGNLGTNELYSVAWDLTSGRILGGAQDNGVALQVGQGTGQWNLLTQGDGTIVQATGTMPPLTAQGGGANTLILPALASAVNGAYVNWNIRITGGTGQLGETFRITNYNGATKTATVNGNWTTAPDNTTTFQLSYSQYFYSTQNFNLSVNNAGTTSSINFTVPVPAAGGATTNVGVAAFDGNIGFVQPYYLNAADPTRMLIGTPGGFLYESLSSFTAAPVNGAIPVTLALLNGGGGLPVGGVNALPVGTTTAPVAASMGNLNSIVYGGFAANGTPMPDVGYVGTQGSPGGDFLFVRQQTQFGQFSPVTSYTTQVNQAVKAVAVDPKDWTKVFVLTVNGQVWTSNDGGTAPGGNWTWTDLTSSLRVLPGTDNLQTIMVDTTNGKTVILVGGEGGVFRKIDGGPWSEFGTGLPNVLISDIDYIPKDNVAGTVDDVLIIGTMGRGAWMIANAGQQLVTDSVVMIKGRDAFQDHIELSSNTFRPWLVDIYHYQEGDADLNPDLSFNMTSIGKIVIDAKGSNDHIVVDTTKGSPIFVAGGLQGNEVRHIVVDGGDGNDTLDILVNSTPIYDSGIKNLGSGSGKHSLTAVNDLGITAYQYVDWVKIENPSESTSSAYLLKNLSAGLQATSRSVAANLSNAMKGQALGGINAGTVATGGNDLRIDRPEPLSDPVVAGLNDEGEEGEEGALLLIGNKTSLFQRLFEEGFGAFDFTDISEDGLFSDRQLLEAALEALDGVDNVDLDDTTDQDGDGTPDLTYTVGIKKRLDATVGLDVAADVLGFLGDVRLTGDLDVEFDVELNLVFGLDSHGFFIKPDANQPEITISNFSVAGDVSGRGRLGFLGVDLLGGTLTMDQHVSIDIDLLDPGTEPDSVGFIRIPELFPDDFSSLLSVSLGGNGNAGDGVASDMVFTGTFAISLLAPGVSSGINLANAELTLSWANLASPESISVSASGGAAQNLVDFLRMTSSTAQDQLVALKNRLNALVDASSALGLDIPFVHEALDDVLDLVKVFDNEILNPLSGNVNWTAQTPTIQEMVYFLAGKLGLSLSDMGLSYNSSSKELTYDLDISRAIASFSDNFNFGFDLAEGLADFDASTNASFSGDVGVKLTVGLDVKDVIANPLALDDAFFIRNPVTGSMFEGRVDFNVADLDASARFGFLSIDIVDGSAQSTRDFTFGMNLADPDNSDSQNQITVSELISGLGSPTTLLGSPTFDGAATAVLPIAVPFLGISDGGTLTVTFDSTGTPQLTVSGIDSLPTDITNFNNIDAPSIVGVLGQLTFWLDEFRRSEAFANLDVPLVGQALDEALQFADAFRDLVLIDDNDTKLDDTKTLLKDLNNALADAGLGRKMFAANVGGHIAVVALDAGITSFTVSGAGALGFDSPQMGSVPLGKFFAEAMATNGFSDAEGNLSADLNFTVTIGSKSYTVKVEKTATDDNTKIGDDRWKLVSADNAPTFATAQQMKLRLLDAFGPTYPGLTYDQATDSLNFSLDLSQVFANLNLPFTFDLDQLPEYLKLQTSGALAFKLSGGLNLDVGVFLGNAEPSDKLQPGTLLANLSQPVVLNDNQRYDAQPVVGKLTADAHFSVAIDGAAAVPVTVTKLAAASNTTLADLVADINTALTTAGLNTKVVAQAVPATGDQPAPQQIQFVGLTVASSLAITANAGDPAVTEIGLATSATVTGANPTLKAAKTLAPLKGRLTADAGFRVELTKGGSTTNIDVALTPAQTQDNDYPFSIVNDIQAQLDPSETRVKVSFSNGALTFGTLDGSAIAVSNVTGTATNELGIVAGSGNSDDLLITVRKGTITTPYRIAFDSGDTTIQHIIDAIQTATTVVGESTPRVTVAINAAGSGLNLTDHTTGSATFKIQTLNNSTAGLLMGIVRSDSSGAENDAPDGVIEGADIAALTALDRFFVKATPVGIDPLAGLTVEIGTPVPLTASAKFGFVDLGLQGQGGLTGTGVTTANNALQAALTLRLLEPAGSTDGRVSLAELIKSLDNPGSLFDFSLTGQGELDLSLTPATIASLSSLGIDVSASPRIEITADMTANAFKTPPHFTVTPQNFDELAGFGNINFNFQSILAGLAALVDFLDDFEGLSFLNDPIPVIDVSVKDLIGFAQKFGDAVTAAENDPAGSLQALEDKLLTAFGLPPGSPQLNLLLVDGPTPGSKVLKIDTQLFATFSKSLPINLDLGLDPLEFGGDANLLAQGSLLVSADFGFDIANPANIYVFNTTGVTAWLDLAANDLDFKAAVGPLGVFVTDGTASIKGTLDAGNKILTAGFASAFGTDGMETIGDIDLGSDLSVNIGGGINVTLPVYFPSESLFAGTVKVVGTLSYSGGKLTGSLTPKAYGPGGTDPGDEISMGQLFAFDPGQLSLLDGLLLGVDGIDMFLDGLQDLLDGTLGGFKLPLVGEKLSGAAEAIGDLRNGFVEKFRKAIEDLANPALAFAEAGIAPGGATLAATSVPQGVDPVSKLLYQLLGPTGLGVVDGTSDIVFDTNIQTETDPSKVYFDWDIHMSGTLANASAGIGFDLGVPGLGLETEGDIHLDVDWALDFGFGVNFDDGFYLDVAKQDELQLTARVTTPGLGITGRLGFLQIEGEENVEADEGADAETERGDTGMTVQFAVDLENRQNPSSDAHLGFAELGRLGVDAKVAGQALADLALSLKLNSDLVPNPGNFPSIVADFAFDWSLGTVDNPATAANEFSGVSLSALNGDFLKNGLDYIGFDDIGLDLGKYFSDVIGPIVDKVQEITGPIKPFLDFLTEPIPVISDLAGPTSLLDIAEMSGYVNPGIIKAIEVVDQVVDIVSDLESAGGTTILYVDELLPGGALTIYQAPSAGLMASSTSGIPNFDPSNPVNLANLKSYVATLPSELGFVGDALDAATDVFSKAVSKMRPGGGVDEGFKLPIIENPSQIFGLLLGQPADLITFTMAPLEVKAEFSAFFSIFGPLGVSINAEFAATFGPFTFGYDTYGISKFAAGDFKNPSALLDGLYVGDLDAQGNDIPELQFDAGLWAAAELNLGIARGGVGGGLFAEIDFNLYDPDDDGKVRINEAINSVNNAIRDGYSALVAPLAVFDISGKLTAELFAFVKVDIPFFPINEKFEITDPIELLSFENVFERRPTLATELGNGVLQLNIGKNAASRIEGNFDDVAEEFFIKAGDPGHVLVWAPQFGVSESEAQEYEASKIVAFAGDSNDKIIFKNTNGPVAVGVELYGDAGNDTLDVSAITGAAFLVGGADTDTLTGGSGGDTLFGGTGTDFLWGGGGNDWLIGDGDHEEYLVGSVITVEVKGSDGADELHGDADDDLLIGAGGIDKLWAGSDDDVLIGDGGEVTVLNDRRVATTRSLDNDPTTNDPLRLELAVRDTSTNGKGAADELRGEAGNDHLYGGFGNELVLLGGDDNDVIYGEDGSDTLNGGGGDDVLFGDFGVFEEVTVGVVTTLEPFVTPGGDKDDISAGSGNDKLLGGAGNDKLVGNEGDDALWGGVGQDRLWGDNEDGTGTGADLLYGEADSDQMRGGNGDDYLEGGGGDDLALGGMGDDTLVGGYGSDTMDGEEGGDDYRISVRGGTITQLTTAYDTGASGVDSLIIVGTPGDDTLLLRAMADSYFPTLEKLQNLIVRYFNSNIEDRLAAMLQAFNDAYGPWDTAHGLYQALTDEYQEGLAAQLKAAAAPIVTDAALQAEINDIIDDVLASDAASKIDVLKKQITAAYNEADAEVPSKLFSALANTYKRTDPGALDDITASIVDYYIAESLYPALKGLQLYVDEVYADDNIKADQRFDAILDRVGDVFIEAFAGERDAILAALQDAWENLPEGATETQQQDALKDAIDTAYTTDPINPNTFTNTAFVAVINEGGKAVERFNYRRMEGMVVSTLGGDDYVVFDDLLAAATINLGEGKDRVQVGQVFRSERVRDPEGVLITGIKAEDVFTTVEITRGWLSNGVSVPTTIYGGGGDDNFTVFHNVAVLNLNGSDGDDVFTVRAFALKGSTDNERARTDMKGDGGADTILYVVNAPVGIDGGDGLDTVRIVGTEFGDDFVITDSGVFGAGLNVSYVNVERLVADGAEGNDRFFVMSTGLDVVTEIDGGLGSDTFFVGGNPSRAPISVVSNDLRGHSGIILHSVESDDSAWDGIPVEGLSANVGDNEDAMILVSESDGRSVVVEGAIAPQFGAIDTYTLRLCRAPALGKKVVLAVVPAGLSPEDQVKNFADLEVWDPTLNAGLGGWSDSRTVVLDGSNWSSGVQVEFRAKQDVGYEGRRFTFINHKITEETSDVTFLDAQTRSIKVQMEDDDRDGITVIPSGLSNTVLEGSATEGFGDSFDVVLTHAPIATVTVTMNVTDPTNGISLDKYTLTFEVDDTNGKIWSRPQTVTVKAVNDTKVEGFHVDYVSFTVTSADHDEVKGPFLDGDVVTVNGTDVTATEDPVTHKVWLQVDGDIDDPGIDNIPPLKPSTFVLLPHRPVAGTVAVRVAGAELAPDRFSVSGNTVTFLTATGAPEFRSGKVEVNYQYKEFGYNGMAVRDQVVDIYDNDSPTVIVRPVDDGMVDVVEGDASATDTYTVRLSSKPTDDVQIVIDSVKTRTTWGANAYYANQLLLSDEDGPYAQSIILTFTPDDWYLEQEVTVAAYDDTVLDGNDTQVFAPDLQTVNKIRGPLIVEGAAGAGSLSLPDPLMMPWERNELQSDGNVVAFVAATSSTGAETMTVEKQDLDPVVARFKLEDLGFTLDKLVGKTLQMSGGPGTGIVLDPNRPRDKFDRFWLITSLELLPDDGEPSTPELVRLVLQNPTAVDPTQPNVTAPDATSEYAITSQSLNFFADEREQVDYMFVYDTDSVADDVGALTSMDGYVLGFDAVTSKMTVETSALQRVATLLKLTTLQQLEGLQLTVTVGPGTGHVYTISDVPELEGDTKELTLTSVSGSGTPTNRSEFRIEGADRYGRITGFGMGPNILFSGRPQGGGITYGDLEVVQVELGRGNDTVNVDYATNSEDHSTVRTGDFYTLTMLNTGTGNDKVTVTLDNGDSTDTFNGSGGDGAFALDTGDGNDEVLGGASTRQLVVFGGRGDDRIVTGSGNDIVFGDLGRVDYIKKFVVDGQEYDAVITRLGSSVPQNPMNPHVTLATDTSISDSAILGTPYEFPTDYDGLVGLSVQVISPEGHVQFRTAIANTADTITVDSEWTQFPVYDAADPDDNFYYRVSAHPDDQTDGQFRTPEVVWSILYEVGGADNIEAGGGGDMVIGGAGGDNLDGGADADLIFGDNVRLDGVPDSGNAIEPRFRSLTGNLIYGADGLVQVGGTGDVPGGTPAWADFTILLDQTLDATHFGDDYIAGGAGADEVFGQLGNDTIQGDGSIASKIDGLANTLAVSAARVEVNGLLELVVNASFEAVGDGDDYIEGNAGSDVIFGNLGQDDIIGGSSTLFSLSTPALRADGSDLIFGGAGTDLSRNDMGDTSANGHAHDSDTIIGDNGNIYRLVGTNDISSGAYLTFNYDTYGTEKIVPRAAELLDYTPGGPDYVGQAGPLVTGDIGAADEVHGESGDDFIYGMAGNDVLFGDGQNDSIIGGYGNDWISGGTGDDGILGDDGRIFSSRNSTSFGEPLYGILAISAANINRLDTTNNLIQVAILNVNGLLKYTADLTPDNLDPNHTATPSTLMPRPTFANDIIYGGLGTDSIHGGAGEDAISGAEALAGTSAATSSYTNNYDQNGNQLNAAPIESDYAHPFNPGNPLGYNPATTKFALYDANDGLRKILLTATGGLSKTASGLEWFLNFDATEGPLDTKWFVGTRYPAKPTDGDDHIFGDLGHDWLVGGAGRDSLWGGWGDDVLNMDDVLTTHNTLNDQTDTNPSWEDLAFGGAGRDVMILNTNGDRAVDWTGEFNSYWTPFNAYGAVSVIRLYQPDLRLYLLDVSESQGADPTLAAQYGSDPVRHGEPFGEIGLVTSKDAAWQDQNGNPRDPQAGNTKGKTDIAKTTNNQPLYETAEGPAPATVSTDLLTDAELAPIVAEAKLLWEEALGAGDSRLGALNGVQVEVGNLPQDGLGATIGNTILIDTNAAGYGWFIDPTPGTDTEFAKRHGKSGLFAAPSSAAFGEMDLLSVVLHEFGHVLGYTDLGSNGNLPGIVMDGTLDAGERLLTSPVRTTKRTAKPAQERQALVFDEKSGEFLDSSMKNQRARIDWAGVQFEPAWTGIGKSQNKEKKDWILEL